MSKVKLCRHRWLSFLRSPNAEPGTRKPPSQAIELSKRKNSNRAPKFTRKWYVDFSLRNILNTFRPQKSKSNYFVSALCQTGTSTRQRFLSRIFFRLSVIGILCSNVCKRKPRALSLDGPGLDHLDRARRKERRARIDRYRREGFAKRYNFSGVARFVLPTGILSTKCFRLIRITGCHGIFGSWQRSNKM